MSVTSPAERDELNHLLVRTGQQDEKAFSTLYRKTSGQLFGVCLRMISDRGQAEEILQEAYVTVWRRAASFDAARASALTWLVTVVRNKAIDRLRQHREMTGGDALDFDAIVDESPTPAAGAEASQEYQRLQECMGELEPRQRTSVREAFFTGATYNELAARAKVPLGTMKSWIRRSLLQLRACLNA
ncbi:sigma-70 family RNA polymerase sigma factor [Pinirhizobacter sp.]|uniref:sigma-70 family RNA polymerase sigma factor n=1 Tax=Pinirhizobacter sp. TaxID=2950432 RepID=UPI002F400396